MSFTVTAAQGGTTANKMAVVVKVVTGAALSQPGATFAAAALSDSVTPQASGSQIYGALTGTGAGASPTAEPACSPFLQSVAGTNRYAQFHLAATTTEGMPVLVGSSAGIAVAIAGAEILAAGTLAEDPSAPANSGVVTGTSVTTAAFTPPEGALLVVMVSSLAGSGVQTMSLSDTSGLGLTWTELAKFNASTAGYNGVWAAQVPSSPTTAPASQEIILSEAF